MQFLQLNNDVILDIFLQFVAIDWDGPFTLMLVCTKWSNLVVSQPRVWTWIMIDDAQAEWRERMEIGAHLSKKLPLQIVLRVPFESQVSHSHITRRCTCLFLDSKPLEDYYFISRSRSWAKTFVSYEQFTTYSAELKQSNDSLVNFLKGAPINGIQIRNEDRHHTSFAYSAWHVYERLSQRASIQDVLKPGETFIITALVFKHGETASLPRMQVLITDLWGFLPLLSNLCYLELSDNYIRAPRDTVLAHMELGSLQTLNIESPKMGSVFFSLEDDVWLGLLSLLDTLTAPNLEDLSLRSPLHRIIAAMIKNHCRIHLLQLNISISVFDETVDQEKLDSKLVWHGLQRCTVDIPEQKKALRHADSEVVDALQLLFNLIPTHCSVQLHGDSILEPIMQSDLLMDVEIHVVTQMDYSGDVHKPLSNPRKIRSLSLTGKDPKGLKHMPWIYSVEELWTDEGSTLIFPHGGSLPMRVLECAPSTQFRPRIVPTSNDGMSDRFSNLTDLHCDDELAIWMITNHETPQLRSLTLSLTSYSFSRVLEVVKKAGNRLLSLDTLGLRRMREWDDVLPFVASFNRSRGRGISTVKLSELPHPAMLHNLGRAFKGEADQPYNSLMHQWSQMRNAHHHCIASGWLCYGIFCTRWHSMDMVTITADMPLTEYEGGWEEPDWQGWERDLFGSDESEMDAGL